MTNVELIAKHGEEWYERLKESNRKRSKRVYDQNPEAERERRRQRYAKDPSVSKRYNYAHREIYRINSRDRNRLTVVMGLDLTGKDVHHLKYHSDNKDASWMDDILIMTPEEHQKWHNEHPDFVAKENIV